MDKDLTEEDYQEVSVFTRGHLATKLCGIVACTCIVLYLDSDILQSTSGFVSVITTQSASLYKLHFRVDIL